MLSEEEFSVIGNDARALPDVSGRVVASREDDRARRWRPSTEPQLRLQSSLSPNVIER